MHTVGLGTTNHMWALRVRKADYNVNARAILRHVAVTRLVEQHCAVQKNVLPTCSP